MSFWGWKPYVSVAERRKKAETGCRQGEERLVRVLSPIASYRGAIAKTFWGKAWCDNLEALQRLCQPPAARPYLCAQRFGDRPPDYGRRSPGAGNGFESLHGRRDRDGVS